MIRRCNESWPEGFPCGDYPLLTGELSKVMEAGKHAFASGYRHAVNEARGKPHNYAEVERFVDERYRFLSTFHPLVSHGFISRFGHYNHSARRNDWPAISRDLVNLHLGPRVPDSMMEVLKDLRYYLGETKGVAITFATNFESFHWPYILRFFDGIMQHVAASIIRKKSRLHVSARKEGERVALHFKCVHQGCLRAKDRKTLRLVKEVVSYFGGEFKINNYQSKFDISITLPYSIRVDGFYGGSYRISF